MLEEIGRRRRFAVAVDADDGAFEPDVLAPIVADRSLYCYLRQRREHGVPVIRWLAVEHAGRRHRNDADRDTLARKQFLRFESQLYLRAGRDQHGPGISLVGEP